MVKDQSLLLFHSLASHNPLLSKPCKFPKTVTLNDGHQMKFWIRPRYYWSIVASCVISFIFTFQNKQISQKKNNFCHFSHCFHQYHGLCTPLHLNASIIIWEMIQIVWSNYGTYCKEIRVGFISSILDYGILSTVKRRNVSMLLLLQPWWWW